MRETHNPFPGRLKAQRKALGLTQEQLAAAVDVTHGTISRLETGKIYPSTQLLLRLAGALDMNPLALFSDTPMLDPELVAIWARISPESRQQALKTLQSFLKDEVSGHGPKPPGRRRPS